MIHTCFYAHVINLYEVFKINVSSQNFLCQILHYYNIMKISTLLGSRFKIFTLWIKASIQLFFYLKLPVYKIKQSTV